VTDGRMDGQTYQLELRSCGNKTE